MISLAMNKGLLMKEGGPFGSWEKGRKGRRWLYIRIFRYRKLKEYEWSREISNIAMGIIPSFCWRGELAFVLV